MKTIDKIITEVNGRYGAPMGRNDIGERPKNQRVYDCLVPMCSCCGCYDKGEAYWGSSGNGVGRLRVSYTKNLSYVHFYREKDKSNG